MRALFTGVAAVCGELLWFAGGLLDCEGQFPLPNGNVDAPNVLLALLLLGGGAPNREDASPELDDAGGAPKRSICFNLRISVGRATRYEYDVV